MKYVFSILLIVLTITGITQNTSKKRVLVIPPSRFEFASAFDLKIIAEQNNIEQNKVFLTYKNALLNSFESYENENFEFVSITSAELKPFRNLIRYKDGKFKGRNYNAVDLTRFSDQNFANLLNYYNADLVVFITWYDIRKQIFSKIRNKRIKYAEHYFDFDVYKTNKQQVVGLGRIQAEAPKPTDLVTPFALLRIQEIKIAYKNFIQKVVEQLNNPVKLK